MDNMQLWLSSSTDSINLNDSAEGFYLNPDLEGLTGLPEIRSVNGLNAGYDGGWTATQLWAARLITIRGVIALNDKAAVETKRKALAKLLAQGKNEDLELKFVSEAGNTYTTKVRTTNCTMALRRVFWRQEYQIQLRANDPLIYDDGGAELVAILRVMAGVNGFEIPFEIPFAIGDSADPTDVNVGDEATYPLITLKGDLHSPTIVNLTTNQQMQVLADIITHVEWKAYTTAQTIDGYLQIQDGLQDAPLSLTHLYGNATQKTLSGKNLLNIDFVSTAPTYAGITITNNGDGTITASGTTTGASGYNLSPSATNQNDPLTLAPNTAYTQRLEILSGSANNIIVVPAFKDSGGTIHYNFFRNNQTTTTTDTMTCSFYNLYWGSAGLTINATFRVWLEKGSDLSSPYEPYVGGIPSPNPDYPQEIKTVSGEQTVKITGKNIFDKDSVSPINAYIRNDGIIGASGSDRLVSIPVMPNTTYTITAERIGQVSGQFEDDFVGALFTSDTAPIVGSEGRRIFGTAVSTYPTLNQTFTTSATENWLAIKVANVQRSDYAGSLATIQLEINDQATPFEPYQGQSQEINLGSIELAKIGTYQDYIWNDDGTWKIHKAIGKYVMDNPYTINVDATSATTTRAYIGNILPETSVSSNVQLPMSDYFIGKAVWSGDNVGLYTANKDVVFRAPQATIGTTSASVQTWLSAHTPTIYYALATPTDTEITDSELIAQLNTIAELYQGTNNMWLIPSAGAQGEMEVAYATDKDVDYHEVVIDCQARTVTQDGQNLYPALAPGSEFIQLVPGQNRLYLTSTVSSDDGTAEVKFKKGNISI